MFSLYTYKTRFNFTLLFNQKQKLLDILGIMLNKVVICLHVSLMYNNMYLKQRYNFDNNLPYRYRYNLYAFVHLI